MKDSGKFNAVMQENQMLKPMDVQLITIGEEDMGQRIDNFLIKKCKGVPKSHLYQLLRSGQVRVNKGRINQLYRLQLNDVVRIPPLRLGSAKADDGVKKPPKAVFHILFEDEHLLIIDKPSGVAVHGGSGVSYGVIEQLRAARPDAKFLELVHRLDRETSGILLLAKKRSALTQLHTQMRDGLVDKRYLTLIRGEWNSQRQHIKLPLAKYTTAEGERRVKVQADGLSSHTIFTLIKRYGEFALLEAQLKTGRTHQIRVHLSASGFALVGDEKYGDFALNRQLLKTDMALKRMFLHAYKITFSHPNTHQSMTVNSPLPKECEQFLKKLMEK